MHKIILFALAIIITASAAFPHPHVKIISRITFDFSGTKCEGCSIEWEFDDYFSGSMIHDFDKNRDGQFDEKEKKNLYNEAFINLKNYGFFVFLRKGKVRSNPQKVENFNAWQRDGKLFYSFYIPFDKLQSGDDFYVAVFDRSFYCAIYYAESPVIIHQKIGVFPVYDITTNKNYPVYYNPYGSPDDQTLYRKWKPGLETAYPDEIRIYFKR